MISVYAICCKITILLYEMGKGVKIDLPCGCDEIKLQSNSIGTAEKLR